MCLGRTTAVRARARLSCLMFCFGILTGSTVNGQALDAVVTDLEDRVRLALNELDHRHHRLAGKELDSVRSGLQQVLNAPLSRSLNMRIDVFGWPASAERVPVVLMIRPHESTPSPRSVRLIEELNTRGIVVIWPDIDSLHRNHALYPAGVTPAQLMHTGIRETVRLVSQSPSLDGNSVGVIGDTFTALVASAIHPQIRAVVLDDMQDFLGAAVVNAKLAMSLADVDACLFVPRLLKLSSLRGLLAMTSPRPLLLIGPKEDFTTIARQEYENHSAIEIRESHADAGLEYATSWIASRLRGSHDERVDLTRAKQEHFLDLYSSRTGVAAGQIMDTTTLPNLLGTPLREGRTTLALDLSSQHEKVVTTQFGIDVPMTILRPGQQGGAAARGLLIALSDEGRKELLTDQLVVEAQRRGWMVWAVDPRGVGSFQLRERESYVFLTSLLLGEHFVWRQAGDISRIIDRLGRSSVSQPTAIYAKGPVSNLTAVYVASLLSDAVEWLRLDPGEGGAPLPATYYSFLAWGPISLEQLKLGLKIPIARGTQSEFLVSEWGIK